MKNTIILDGVTYYANKADVDAIDKNKQKIVNQYEWLKSEIENEVEKAQALYDDMKQNGLNFNSVEAEGYLRCAIFMKNTLAHIEEMSNIE